MGTPSTARLARRDRAALALQRGASRVLSPLWVPACALVLRFGFGWRVEGAREARREYRRLQRTSRAPLLVCPNHLTLADSFLVAHALGSPADYLLRFRTLPWNLPDRENFAGRWWSRLLIGLAKCIPVPRRGERTEVVRALERARFVLARGEAVLVFPEGGRSRSGRVEVDSAAYGVGRLVRSVPGCRVLCVYLRGESQASWSSLPRRGERFRVRLALLEPKSDRKGVRGSVEVARQIVTRLAELERELWGEAA